MYPKISQNIMIELKNVNKTCKSIVAEIEENEILIVFPMLRTIMGHISEGDKLEISYLINENKYKFDSQVIGRKNGTVPLLRITKPIENEIVRVQRRDNFRVKANLDLIVNDTTVTTLDISGGGLQFTCKTDLELQEGSEMTGTLIVPTSHNNDSTPINFVGQVKRIQMNKDESLKNVAVQFTKLNQKDQMKIIQFCNYKLRQIRLK
ncbi:flagellar brake domain-containing protein [Neobacillus sedimentimangrovi]|jgi:c-di-GMP-binding flagellar brake protein YcgR|uniref:Flagellar brake domain-containing protein n=1 Tax=Neobacillus sedimentimangrovi TaxID=2699460 RepID=A0ABS8QKD6_9BACI|nr:flagellar brake domain-containing protein [Neobacillus sedimentimangrovi]MCD4839683.1 flagellar brake domain-containing protein [Neobacillus sedimentimangrovi]